MACVSPDSLGFLYIPTIPPHSPSGMSQRVCMQVLYLLSAGIKWGIAGSTGNGQVAERPPWEEFSSQRKEK